MTYKVYLKIFPFFGLLAIVSCKMLPQYYDQSSSEILLKKYSQNEIITASKEALDIIGCDSIKVDNKKGIQLIGERQFIIGFICGSGGETLKVDITLAKDNIESTVADSSLNSSLKADNIEENYLLKVTSYKRTPYTIAPLFKNKEFIRYLKFILNSNHLLVIENEKIQNNTT